MESKNKLKFFSGEELFFGILSTQLQTHAESYEKTDIFTRIIF